MLPTRLLYAATIFLSSLLLFLIEPIAAKQLLPILGGSSAVWLTCLVFFQCTLLLGYLYAHWIADIASRWAKPIHFILLAARRRYLSQYASFTIDLPQLRTSPHHLPRPHPHHRPSLSPARLDKPTPTGLASPLRIHSRPLPPLRTLQPRLTPRSLPLSHPHRTAPHPPPPAIPLARQPSPSTQSSSQA